MLLADLLNLAFFNVVLELLIVIVDVLFDWQSSGLASNFDMLFLNRNGLRKLALDFIDLLLLASFFELLLSPFFELLTICLTQQPSFLFDVFFHLAVLLLPCLLLPFNLFLFLFLHLFRLNLQRLFLLLCGYFLYRLFFSL